MMDRKTKMLIVEDDKVMQEGLSFAFQSEGYQVVAVDSVQALKNALFHDGTFDILVLDCNLPDGDGFAICRELKQQFRFPVVLLTARDMEEEMIEGLEAGADDYVTKPFFLEVFKLRIKNVMKRLEEEEVVCSKGISIYLEERRVLYQNIEVNLGKSEYELQLLFFKNRNRVLTRDMIWDYIWGTREKYVDDSNIFMLVSRLWGRLKEIGREDCLKTVHGVGYLWEDK